MNKISEVLESILARPEANKLGQIDYFREAINKFVESHIFEESDKCSFDLSAKRLTFDYYCCEKLAHSISIFSKKGDKVFDKEIILL